MVKNEFIIKGYAEKPISVDIHPSESTGHQWVIFVHGFKGFKDWGAHNLVAGYFAAQGFNFLKFNFSHNGTTPDHPCDFADLEAFGTNTFTKELLDLDAVITFAKSGEKFPEAKEIILLGHSRGGGISIVQAANDNRVNKLVTWASISDFSTLWRKDQEKEWKENGVIFSANSRTKQDMPLYIDLLHDLEKNAARLDIKKNASKISIPWLIIHGKADESVLPYNAEKLHQQNNKSEIALIEEANHVFGAVHPYSGDNLPETLKSICDRTIDFLKR